ncbi:MAG: hypothetical protein HYU54_05210, partial [Actinobacteria bacterium]|nr:hypothetical protein [Actinomycetota bacterium]
MSRGRHAARPRVPFGPILVALVVLAGVVTAWRLVGGPSGEGGGAPRAEGTPRSPTPAPTPAPNPSPSPSPSAAPTPGPINTSFPGLTTFRGNAERTYYGEGPIPLRPKVLWRYPSSGSLCSTSTDQHGPRTWCGTGWTGQPNVVVHEDGTVEVRFGAYDGHYHFLDGTTG